MDKKSIFITLTLVILSSISLFSSGYYVKSFIDISSTTEIKSDTKVDTNTDENESTSYLPDKNYFDDTIILVSKNEPHYTLVATANRSEGNDSNYNQGTRISFFNGTEWKRITRSDANPNSSITNNKFINDWNINYDRSRVLKQTVAGNLNFGGSIIYFETQVLENEIGIRSLPGYTKFMSEGDGKIIIDGNEFESHVLYTRVYSSNSSELFTYDGNIGLLTDWIAFWDNNGNFYHIDSTNVTNPIPNYQTHSIGILKNQFGGISKTFSVSVNRDALNPPQNYEASLGYPIDKTLKFTKYNDINKAPNNSYSWHMGNIKNDSGIGLVEYILK